MIRLSNGHEFAYVASSGALAYDGRGWPWEWPLRWAGLLDPSLFTVVTKTLTRRPRRGNLRWSNPFGCVRFVQDGVVNAVGLTNPGIEWWCRAVGPHTDRKRIPLVVSILSEDPEELAQMAERVHAFDVVGVEINASCPNSGDDALRNTKQVIRCCVAVQRRCPGLPVWLKLSVTHDARTIATSVEGLVEAFSINSVPWDIAFPGRRSPLAHLGGGGVSGKAAQHHTWGLVWRLVEASAIPVIGPGVWEFADIERLRALGAKAVSFGSIFLRHPLRPTRYIRRDKRRIAS